MTTTNKTAPTPVPVPALTNAGSKYGAGMGRVDYHLWEGEDTRAVPCVFHLIVLVLQDGDYDSGGAYWGYTAGTTMYRAVCMATVGGKVIADMYFRATSEADAKAMVLAKYPNATFLPIERDPATPDEPLYWYTSSSGEIEFQMTWGMVQGMSHSGQCDADVASGLMDPFLTNQLAKIKPRTLRSILREYGAWDGPELADHQENLARLLWLAANDISDSTERDSQGQPAEEWMQAQFEFEYCGECGKDAEDHTAVLVLGNWFARCDKPTEAQ